ncbi:hypothetical protein F2P81_019335 [Scophthalmus maximus]|uniref:Proteasome activator PA28 N-terminal domain-containing protein n=1 Tax=Scophthalmus maximus TaxID=52904 RepID=A0A6A4S7P4_SCOMX|nr:hypothetical protein F2P81_019335 [Scophthalmus maximus]
MAALDIHLDSQKQAEVLVSKFFPQKIEELQMLLKTSSSCGDLASLRAPLDIPMPDPAKEEAKRKKEEEAVLFDVITKNYDKIKKPKGDGKALIY